MTSRKSPSSAPRSARPCCSPQPTLKASPSWPRDSCVTRSRSKLPRRSEEHTSELQSHLNLVCRLLLEKKKPTALLPHPLPFGSASPVTSEPTSLTPQPGDI